MSFMDFMFGRGPQMQNVNLLTPQQQQLQGQYGAMAGQGGDAYFNYLMSILSNDPGAFEQFERPIMRQFEQQVVPGISERFAGMGSGGAMSSSGLNQSLGQAGQQLSENLAAMRQGLKMQAGQGVMSMLNPAMQQSFQPQQQSGQMGWLPMFMAQAAGSYLGNKWGG